MSEVIITMKQYSELQIQKALTQLNSVRCDGHKWLVENHKLTKSFTFKNFIDAFGWMSQIAICAEKLNHHPDWLNSYNKVVVSLTTHELGGLSELDFKLAEKMDFYIK
ncbi:4a-hydroxytetrahydrobiopterin dehydratase [uncultured Paraglaciecola sp.]|uniref:4a-hydroxytetrahydrobiopterin dehydratase n=1 Tax=uncultured Paraglaciecola sp. TaxID=1765024 RepID=UPI002593CAA2|nr:4a-hydroxytetrahydrobiopterin dehydratase [uncultured Paraglaciecola sp.]